MKTIKYNRYIFFEKKTVGTPRKLTRVYGVKYNSYAGEVLRRIHHYFFGDSIDIEKEYKRYYKKEYETLDIYLECHLGIPENVRKKFEGHRVFYTNLDDKGEHIGNCFSYEQGLSEQFWMIIGGLDDENSRGIRYEQLFY